MYFLSHDLPKKVGTNPVSQHMVQCHQKPQRQPKRWCQDDVGVIEEQQDLEDRWCNVVLFTVSKIPRKVPHKALVESVIEIFRLHPDFEDQIFCGRGMRPESMSTPNYISLIYSKSSAKLHENCT